MTELVSREGEWEEMRGGQKLERALAFVASTSLGEVAGSVGNFTELQRAGVRQKYLGRYFWTR